MNNFKTYLFLCLVSVFVHGLFLKLLPDLRVVKIMVVSLCFMALLISIFLRTPEKGLLKFCLINGFLLFATLELSKYFTYLLIGHSKYFENWTLAFVLMFVLTMIVTYSVAIIGQRFRHTNKTS